MADEPVGRLRVSSDLRLVVDGVSTDILADGDRITVRTDDPTRLFAEAAAASLPRDAPALGLRDVLNRVGRVLSDTGLSAQVDGERGVVLEIGHGCASRTGRLLLGSADARLGSAAAVLPVAAAYVVSAVRRRVTLVVAGAAVAALLGGGALARRRLAAPTRGLPTLGLPTRGLTPPWLAAPLRSWRRGGWPAGTRG